MNTSAAQTAVLHETYQIVAEVENKIDYISEMY